MSGQYNLKNTGKFCLKCGTQNRDGVKFCIGCGTNLEGQMVRYKEPQPQSQQQYQVLQPGQSRRRQFQDVQAESPLQYYDVKTETPQQRQPAPPTAPQQRQPAPPTAPQQRQPAPPAKQQQHQPARANRHQQYQTSRTTEQRQHHPLQDEEPPQEKKKKKTAVVITVTLIILAIAAALIYYFSRSALETPPDMRAYPKGPERIEVSGKGGLFGSRGGLGGSSVRDTSKYTFLVLGADAGEANTDVIMAVTFDTSNYTFDIVNIPRDTLVNVSWPTKKANSIFANMRHVNRGEDDAEKKTMDATVASFGNVLGFEVDYWVRVDMKAFVSLVDAIDGVEFYVPVDMNYTDAYADLTIKYTKGTHHLSGQQALEVLRFRSGYSMGDIGRIGTQQDFLKSAAEQILEKRSSISITTLAKVFLNDVKTDMKLSDLIWFGREFMKLDAENVNFHMLPGNTGDSVGRQSYVTIYVDEWLDMVNSILSPFYDEITAKDVSILTRGSDKKMYVTDGNWRADPGWGS